jgi:glycosyl hydrolase family 26
MTRLARHPRRLPLALLATVALLLPAGPAATRADARPLALGVYIPEGPRQPGKLDRYGRLLGRSPAIVSDYKQWDFAPFVKSELREVWERGAVPMITWEPMSYFGNRYPLRAIAHGRFDRYARRAARAAASWGHPVLLRFAHEMNGDWYDWGRGVRGNTARRYKRAWRRLVRIFRGQGADNVRWVWCPNVNQGGNMPFRRFFPGDAWVDWVGLDGFNWGYGGVSYSFREIFAGSYRTLSRISRRPLMIAETGAGNRGKARWIRQALGRQLAPMRRIEALVWFNEPVNGVDLRFNGSRAGLRAFRAQARLRRFGAGRERLLTP